MAVSCPIDLDTLRLRQEIQSVYSRVATGPDGSFHFHRGPEYAVRVLSYDPAALAALPAVTTASFAGVANPHLIAPIYRGAAVVDVGCGSGMDLLLAAKAVGPPGQAIGVDMTEAMLARAHEGANAIGLDNVDVRLGDALALPVESNSADFVLSNGVLNLTPDKRRAYAEVFHVLKPGGRFLYGDIIVATELAESLRGDIDLWTG
jgi:SAM-dependent methyltransferase